MDEAKLRSIIEAMHGITYVDWNHIRIVIDEAFSAEASKQSKKIVIASPDEIVSRYPWSL